jgi:hypothetical protein
MTEEVHKYIIAQYIKWFNVSLIMYWSLSHCYWDIIHSLLEHTNSVYILNIYNISRLS